MYTLHVKIVSNYASGPPLAGSTSHYGFTCKVWIASKIEEIHLGGTYYVWFATELNPIANDKSAIPLEIYREIDVAVKTRLLNHWKIESVKANLLLAVSRQIAPADPEKARELRLEIETASLDMFRPQLWRINLQMVDASRWRKDGVHPGWDEQILTDLRRSEFEIVVE